MRQITGADIANAMGNWPVDARSFTDNLLEELTAAQPALY
jgi:hypothetical protein